MAESPHLWPTHQGVNRLGIPVEHPTERDLEVFHGMPTVRIERRVIDDADRTQRIGTAVIRDIVTAAETASPTGSASSEASQESTAADTPPSTAEAPPAWPVSSAEDREVEDPTDMPIMVYATPVFINPRSSDGAGVETYFAGGDINIDRPQRDSGVAWPKEFRGLPRAAAELMKDRAISAYPDERIPYLSMLDEHWHAAAGNWYKNPDKPKSKFETTLVDGQPKRIAKPRLIRIHDDEGRQFTLMTAGIEPVDGRADVMNFLLPGDVSYGEAKQRVLVVYPGIGEGIDRAGFVLPDEMDQARVVDVLPSSERDRQYQIDHPEEFEQIRNRRKLSLKLSPPSPGVVQSQQQSRYRPSQYPQQGGPGYTPQLGYQADYSQMMPGPSGYGLVPMRPQQNIQQAPQVPPFQPQSPTRRGFFRRRGQQ